MYFPPYKQLLSKASIKNGATRDSDLVTIRRDLFEFVLQAALATSEFDEEAYLSANPDVADGPVRNGEMTARQHFVAYGYFENREGGLPTVDADWYEKTYVDVKRAISEGRVKSATQHFEVTGAFEGRAPTQRHLLIAEMWKKLRQM